MTHYRSLSHTKWTCQYHVVFIPKFRKKVIYGELRRDLGEVLRRLAQQRESEVEEGHLMVDHVHIMLSIPPKYSVAQVIGYIKGKSAIHIARHYAGRPRNSSGSTSGLGDTSCPPALLGSGILRVHRGSRRTGDSHVYPGPGRGRPSARTASVGSKRPPLGGSSDRSAVTSCRFERLTN